MGQIKVTKAPIEGLYIIETTKHGDDRGYFVETYNARDMKEFGLDMVFVQDNQSMSGKGVLRGLHFQIDHPQGKLVRVIRGEVYDVAVDLREGSPTYGQWSAVFCPRRTAGRCISPKASPTVSWSLAIRLNSATKSLIFIIPATRAE